MHTRPTKYETWTWPDSSSARIISNATVFLLFRAFTVQFHFLRPRGNFFRPINNLHYVGYKIFRPIDNLHFVCYNQQVLSKKPEYRKFQYLRISISREENWLLHSKHLKGLGANLFRQGRGTLCLSLCSIGWMMQLHVSCAFKPV
jgi:hypothetical protein